MASISKISTQIVADARQFNSTVIGAEKLAESVFARMAKLEFIPGRAKIGTERGAMKGLGPIQIDVTRGDSLQAVYDLLARIRERANKTGVAISTALNPHLPNTIRVPVIDNRNSVGPVMPSNKPLAKTSVSRVTFTKLPDQAPGPFAPRQQYVSNTPESVRNRAFAPVEISHMMGFRDRMVAVYKSIGAAGKLAGIVVGQAMSHPGTGGAKEFGAAWKQSFDRLIPTARTAYKMFSKPLTLTWRVLGAPDVIMGRALARLRPMIQNTARSFGNTLSSFVPSPHYAALGMLASVGISTYQFHEYIEKVSRAAIETKEFGVSAGASTYDIQRMQFALRYMGQDAKGAVEALKTIEQLQTASKIGDYATTDLMTRLGGDAGLMLRTGEDIDDVMDSVNKAITSQGAGVRAVTLAMQVYGDNAERVLRYALLTQKTKDALGRQMNFQGNVIEPDVVSQLQQTERIVNRIGMAFEGVVAKAVTAFAPLVLSTLEIVGEKLSGLNTDKMIADIKKFVVYAAVVVANIPAYFSLAADGIVYAIGYIGEAIDRLSARLYRFQADANRMMGGFDKAKLLEGRAEELDHLVSPQAKREDKPWYSQMKDDAGASIVKTLMKMTAEKDILARMTADAGKAVEQQKPYDMLTAMTGMMRSKKLLVDGALQTAKEVEQPFEKLQARLSALDLMKGLEGNMSMETYGRAVLKAFNEIESGLQLTDIRLPGLARKDSTEAVSAINRSEVEYKMKIADTPAVRQQRILEQSYEVLLLIKEYAAKSAEAATNRKIVSVGP